MLSQIAHAKINISLRVGNKLPTGMHQLATLIAPIALSDTVRLRLVVAPSSSCRVIVGSELANFLSPIDRKRVELELSSVENNLAAQAARLVLAEKNFELEIEKNIPLQAGLGGGSSNAAVALLLANKLVENSFSHDQLLNFAANLGSDVGPMLFDSPILQSNGALTPATIPVELVGKKLLLVKPTFGTSTKAAYESLKRGENSFIDESKIKEVGNDFEEVFAKENWFIEAKRCLSELGAERVILCGSGSSIVGIFESSLISNKCVEHAKNSLKNWWVYLTEFWS